jgi:hypothetical protein
VLIRSTHIFVRALALAICLVFASSATAASYGLFECGDGSWRTKCCCPKRTQEEPVDRVQRSSCCAMAQVELDAPLSTPTAIQQAALSYALLPAVDHLVRSAALAPRSFARELLQRPTGPPILLSKCVLLI